MYNGFMKKYKNEGLEKETLVFEDILNLIRSALGTVQVVPLVNETCGSSASFETSVTSLLSHTVGSISPKLGSESISPTVGSILPAWSDSNSKSNSSK